MSLTNKDKIHICSYYDTILNRLQPLSNFMKHPLYPNFINFDYEPTEEEQRHIDSAFTSATLMTDHISTKSREDILNFIGQPGFLPNLHVHTRVLNKYATSLEDTILYREVKESVIINKLKMGKRDTEKYIKVTKCFKIQLTKDLSYVLEKSLFVQEPVFELIEGIVKRNTNDMVDPVTLNELIWQEIIKREAAISEIKDSNNFTSTEELNEYLTGKYGYGYKGIWTSKGVIKLDNRKPLANDKKPESLVTSYKKSL